jgi:hypothetical protein
VLRGALSTTEGRGGRAYAAARRDFCKMHAVEGILESLLMTRGPEADAKRARASPDHLLSGPDLPLEGPIAGIRVSS